MILYFYISTLMFFKYSRPRKLYPGESLISRWASFTVLNVMLVFFPIGKLLPCWSPSVNDSIGIGMFGVAIFLGFLRKKQAAKSS